MSKTIIEVKCTDQVLTLTNTPVIASGGVGEDFVSVEFCPMWDNYAPALLFWRKGVEPIFVVEDADGLFQVPAELTGVDGIVYFGAVGYDADGTRRTSQVISYRLEAGAITEGTEMPAPSGDVFDQIMAHYADVKLYVATRIDEAADAAEASHSSAEAAWLAADEAQRRAGDAVDAVDGVAYPGIVEGYWHNDSENIGITLDRCPPDKMLLTFRVPYYTSTIKSHSASWLRVSYPGVESNTGYELFSLRNGFSQVPPKQAISPGDVITVLLTRSDNESYGRCYLLNSRITKTTLDEMNRRIYPGIPTSKTTNGTMVISLDFEPEEKFFMVFAADEASSAVSKFVLDYESYEEGPVQVEYALWDAKDSPVKSYGFYQGDHVVVVLSPADKRATVLNPRVTRDTMNLIQGVVDMVPSDGNNYDGKCSIVSYVGDGTSSVYLRFPAMPRVIHIESIGTGGYCVSATLFKAELAAKLRVFSDGNYYESVVACNANWGVPVMLKFDDYNISPGHLNVLNTKYVAIGIM